MVFFINIKRMFLLTSLYKSCVPGTPGFGHYIVTENGDYQLTGLCGIKASLEFQVQQILSLSSQVCDFVSVRDKLLTVVVSYHLKLFDNFFSEVHQNKCEVHVVV